VVAINLATVKHKYQVIFALVFLSLYGCAAAPARVDVQGLNKRIARLERSLDEGDAKLDELESKFHLLREKLDSGAERGKAKGYKSSAESLDITPPPGLKVIRLGEKSVIRIKGQPGADGGGAVNNGGIEKKNPAKVRAASAKKAKSPLVDVKKNHAVTGGERGHASLKLSSATQSSAKDMYAEARKLFVSGKFSKARTIFLRLTTAYPKSDLADNAFYWSAESYYRKKDFRDAIVLYDVVVERYPRGNKAADALMGLGAAYDKLGDGEKAKSAFQRVVKDYPESAAAKGALKRLKLL